MCFLQKLSMAHPAPHLPLEGHRDAEGGLPLIKPY